VLIQIRWSSSTHTNQSKLSRHSFTPHAALILKFTAPHPHPVAAGCRSHQALLPFLEPLPSDAYINRSSPPILRIRQPPKEIPLPPLLNVEDRCPPPPSSLYFSPNFWPPPVLDPSPISPEQVTTPTPTACRSAVSTPHLPPTGVPLPPWLFGELLSPHCGKMDSSWRPPPPGSPPTASGQPGRHCGRCQGQRPPSRGRGAWGRS
jgi:hypothetical protein